MRLFRQKPVPSIRKNSTEKLKKIVNNESTNVFTVNSSLYDDNVYCFTHYDKGTDSQIFDECTSDICVKSWWTRFTLFMDKFLKQACQVRTRQNQTSNGQGENDEIFETESFASYVSDQESITKKKRTLHSLRNVFCF